MKVTYRPVSTYISAPGNTITRWSIAVAIPRGSILPVTEVSTLGKVIFHTDGVSASISRYRTSILRRDPK